MSFSPLDTDLKSHFWTIKYDIIDMQPGVIYLRNFFI